MLFDCLLNSVAVILSSVNEICAEGTANDMSYEKEPSSKMRPENYSSKSTVEMNHRRYFEESQSYTSKALPRLRNSGRLSGCKSDSELENIISRPKRRVTFGPDRVLLIPSKEELLAESPKSSMWHSKAELESVRKEAFQQLKAYMESEDMADQRAAWLLMINESVI